LAELAEDINVLGAAHAAGVRRRDGCDFAQECDEFGIDPLLLALDPSGVNEEFAARLGEERQVYRPGFRFINVDAEWGRFGLMIGSDVVFPEAARSLTLDGAELLVLAANWEAGRREQWRAHIVSRATENAAFVAAANRVGAEPTIQFAGDSIIAGPEGEHYTVLEEPMEGYAIARIDLDRVRVVREERQLIQFREPNAYRAIVRKY